MAQTPLNVFLEWLASRPRDCRVAITLDGDSLLMDVGVLGKPNIADTLGRLWYPVVFRGNDLAFRMRFRSACSQGSVVVVLAGSRTGSGQIDVSWISDILALNEGGDPLDLSLPAFFRRICPKINFPESPLRRYKDALMERLEEVPSAASKIIDRWGRPDDWGNGQIAAWALLAKHPAFKLSDIWPNETHTEKFMAHCLRLLLATPALASDRSILLEIFRESAQPQVKNAQSWFDWPTHDLAGYLVLRLVAEQYRLQNPATQLIGLQLFDPDMNLSKLDPLSIGVIGRLRSEPDTWDRIEELAGTFLTPKRFQRFEALISGQTDQGRVEYLQRSDIVPLMAARHLLAVLKEFFDKPSVSTIEWVDSLKLAKSEVIPLHEGRIESGTDLNVIVRLLRSIRRIECILATPVPSFGNPEALLDWYVDSGHYEIELTVARAWNDLVACREPELIEAGQRYVFGEAGDLNPEPGSLRERIRIRLDELDTILADMITTDPTRFMQGPRSATFLIRQKLDEQLKRLRLGTLDGRIWILVLDGMRYDTWENVVRPILSGHFEVDAQSFFAVLPTFTLYARSSLLGGCLPGQGINSKGEITYNETILAARNLGLTEEERKGKLRLVTDAETTSALMRLGFKEKDAREINILIYPISDDCHNFKGDLVAFNHRIRSAILGDKTQGSRGILDDLLARIKPEDTGVITSDHGFIELLRTRAIVVPGGGGKAPDDTAEVEHRYISENDKGISESSLTVTVEKRRYQIAVGSAWFKREGVSTFPRYNHGGCSLAEMVIPGALLRRLTGKVSRVVVEGLPTQLVVEEDATAEVVATLRNAGNVDMSVSIGIYDNLGNVVGPQEISLKVGQKTSISGCFVGRYRQTVAREMDPTGTVTAISLRVRYTDQEGKWRDLEEGTTVIPVRVKPKPTLLETDALKDFDDA